MEKFKFSRKILAVLLAALLVFTTIPGYSVFADSKNICPDCTNGKVKVTCSVCNGSKTVTCPDCNGTGVDELGDACATCNGTKVVDCDNCSATGEVEENCTTCNGTGKAIKIDCPKCNGDKKCQACNGSGVDENSETCSECGGTGDCKRCDGKGYVYAVEDDTFEFENVSNKKLNVGDTYTNVAKSTNNDGKITYKSSDEESVSVSDNGVVTALKPTSSEVVITASIKPSSKDGVLYAADDITYKISSVSKATPVLSDVKATAITYGSSLNDSTITGTATVNSTEIEGTFSWVDNTVVPTVADSENTEYEVEFTPNDTDLYEKQTVKVKLTVNGAPITDVTVTGYNGQYDKQTHNAVTVENTLAGDKVSYKVGDASDYTDVMPTVKDVVNETVYVKVERENHLDFETQAQVTVNPKDINGVSINQCNVNYDGQSHPVLTFEGDEQDVNDLKEDIVITYNGHSYDMNSNVLSFTEAGTYNFTLKTSNYKINGQNSIELTAAINKINPFESLSSNLENDTVSYSKDLKVETELKKNTLFTGEASYAVDGGATIDTNGVVSVTKAGTYTVTASFDGDNNFNAQTLTYTFTVLKADYTPEFAQTDVKVSYGTKTVYTNVLNGVESTGLVEYSIVSNENEIVENVSNTGEITFANGKTSGQAVIKAVIATDDCYKEETAQYTVSVYQENGSADTYTVSTPNENGWYNGKLTVSAIDGYKICKTPELLMANYTTSLDFDLADSAENQIKFYIRQDLADSPSAVVTVNDIKSDTTKPTVSVSYDLDNALYKVINNITFGFFNDLLPCKVILKGNDNLSGVKYFNYNYFVTDTVNTANQGNSSSIVAKANDNDSSLFEAEFEIPAQFRGQVTATAVDNAGNESAGDTTPQTAVVDTENPVLSAELANAPTNEKNGISYFDNDVTVKVNVNEENFMDGEFGEKDINISATIIDDNGNQTVKTYEVNDWARVNNTDNWLGTFKVTDEGDYTVNISYTDKSGNTGSYSFDKFTIDKTAPVITSSYNNAVQEINGVKYYNAQTQPQLKFTVDEHNFDSADFASTITAKDINGNDIEGVQKAIADYCKVADNWQTEGNVHTIAVPLENNNANYVITAGYTDNALHTVAYDTADKLTYDTESSSVEIKYNLSDNLFKVLNNITFGFFGKLLPCEVTLKSTDNISGINHFEYSFDVNDTVNTANVGGSSSNATPTQDKNDKSSFETKFEIPAQFRGQVTAKAVDNSNNAPESKTDDKTVVVDTKEAEIDVTFDNEPVNEKNGIAYYDSNITATVNVNEENFMDGEYGQKDIKISAKIIDDNGNQSVKTYEVNDWARVNNTDLWKGTFELADEGDYTLDISYTDKSGNTGTYSKTDFTIDKTAPVITSSYNNAVQEINGVKYYNAQTQPQLKFTVDEHNFDSADFASTITAKDINGNDIEGVQKAIADYCKVADNWQTEGNVHTIAVPLENNNANYVITAGYTDNALHTVAYDTADKLTYDTESSSVEIKYNLSDNLFKVLNNITFGFFGKLLPCEVTLKSTDNISGINHFEYSFDVNDTVNTANVGGSSSNATPTQDENDKSSFETTFEIPAQFRGQVTAKAVDNSNNAPESVTDDKTIVVDTINPEITASYNAPANVEGGISYYDKNVNVTLNVNEENFMDGEFGEKDIKISAQIIDDNGNQSVKTYDINNWARVNNTDNWQGTFELADEGDYTLNISYTDKSGNTGTYSKTDFTIDKTAPVITSSYNNAVQEIDGIKYYNAQTQPQLKFTVKEHNFNADYFASTITAKNVVGQDVFTNDTSIKSVEEMIKSYCANADNWTTQGNVHTITVPLEENNANYIITANCKDKAFNASSYDTADKLTYDTVEPEISITSNVAIVYKVLDTITFGIFNEKLADYPATIFITAKDKTSGVNTINYATTNIKEAIGSIADTQLTVNTENLSVTSDTSNGEQIWSYKFQIPSEFRNSLNAVVVDKSQLSSSANTIKDSNGNEYSGVIADTGKIDEQTPENGIINIQIDKNADYASKDTFAKDFSFSVSIKDQNAGIGDVQVTINNQEVTTDETGNSIAKMYDKNGNSIVRNIDFKVNTSQVDKAKDGVYKLVVKAKDNANNAFENEYTGYIDVYAPMITDFSFDTQGKAYIGNEVYKNNEKVATVADDSTYNYYFEKDTKITVYATDYNENGANNHTSGIQNIDLLAINVDGSPASVSVVDSTFVQSVNNIVGSSQITYLIKGPFKGNILARATDYAGNYPTLKQTNGIVLDQYLSLINKNHDGYVEPYNSVIEDVNKHSEKSTIAITPKQEATATENYAYAYKYDGNATVKDAVPERDDNDKVPLYNSNVTFGITVKDEYSGIKQIDWKVIGQEDQDAKNNQQGSVTVNNVGEISDATWKKDETDNNLVTSMSRDITVKNNSNDIVLLVELTDRAGNKSYDYYTFGIDKTAPSIQVSLDKEAKNKKYFDESRTVTVTVTERNFKAKDFDMLIQKNSKDVSRNGAKLKWQASESSINSTDATTHTTSFVISAEGDYSLGATFKDLTGLTAQKNTKFVGSAAKKFIIDKTAPKAQISMTGESKNKKYFFNEDRTVTVVVTERNFRASDAVVTVTKDGEAQVMKNLSWKADQTGLDRTNSTKHTTTFTISAEGDYTFAFDYVDLAERKLNKAEYASDDCEQFTIDKTAPKVVVSDTVLHSANNGKNGSEKVQIPLTVTINDKNIGDNYNNNSVDKNDVSGELNYVGLDSNSKYADFKISKSDREEVKYTVADIKQDGLYNLVLNVMDCAGNKVENITYNSAKNKTANQSVTNGRSNFFTFSVNRNGSTYSVNNATRKLVGKYYVQNVDNDIVIDEINVDTLTGSDLKKNVKITKNDEVIDALSYVKVENTSKDDSWQKYSYIIDKSCFADEAEYKVSIESKDRANNNEYSELTMEDDLKVNFVVDRTKPVAVISGATSGETYAKPSQDVTVKVSDDVLLTNVEISVNGSVVLSASGKELNKYMSNGQFVWTTTIKQSSDSQSISVKCTDAAGNTNFDTNKEPNGLLVDNFLVTTDVKAQTRFWIQNNIVWFILICVAAVAVVSGVTVLIVKFRKKKNDK